MRNKSHYFGRIIPIVTLISAAGGIAYSLIWGHNFSYFEVFLIALLTLLAGNVLHERISLLESIQSSINDITSSNILQNRSKLIDFDDFIDGAKEVCILAVSASSLTDRYANIISQVTSSDSNKCCIRIILMNPDSDCIKSFDKIYPIADTANTVNITLRRLQSIKMKSNCSINLIDALIPFSLIATDIKSNNGRMTVEFYGYKKHAGDFPHVYLTHDDNRHWFEYFRDQFELAWKNSVKWDPKERKISFKQ